MRKRTHVTHESDVATRQVAVECRGLEKRYPDGRRSVRAVAGVSFDVPAGTLTLVTGPSGCGKTTLLSMLGGMVAPTAGEIRLWGRSIVHLRDRHRAALRREDVGFVFQEFALVPEMTVEENLLLPLVPCGGPTQRDEAQMTARLERAGLADARRMRAGRLSGGERQRVAILRALVRDPPLLLLDEPTAHLDATSARELLTWLDALRGEPVGDRPRTLVVATHDPRMIAHSGVDRVIAMAEGKLVSEGSTATVPSKGSS